MHHRHSSSRPGSVLWLGIVALAAALAPAPASGQPLTRDETWLRSDALGFTLLTNATAGIAGEVARNMEALHNVILRDNPTQTPRYSVPTWVLVFRDADSFTPYASEPSGRRLRVDGLFVGHALANYIALNAQPSRSPYPVIYHEYTHYLIDSLMPGLPLWLSEGLAEYYSTLQILGAQTEIGRPVLPHVLWLREHGLMSWDDLAAVTPGSDDYSEGTRSGTFYAQSWATVHYLMRHDPTSLFSIGHFATLLDKGLSQEEALTQAFGTSSAGLVQGVRAYATRGEYAHATVGDVHGGVAERPARAPRRAEVLAQLGFYLAIGNTGRTGFAEEHLQRALDLDPFHMTAMVGLGFLRYKERRYEDAITLLDSALEQRPDEARAASLLGQTLIARHAAETPDEVGLLRYLEPDGPLPEDLARARALLKTGLSKGAPRGELFLALGYTYLFDPDDPAGGITALERGRVRVGERPDADIHLAILYLRADRRDAALELLDAIEAREPGSAAADLAGRVFAFSELREIDMLLSVGRPDLARDRLDALSARTSSRDILAAIESQDRRIERQIRRAREIEELDGIIAMIAAGTLVEAELALRDFLAVVVDPNVRSEARYLLKELTEPPDDEDGHGAADSVVPEAGDPEEPAE